MKVFINHIDRFRFSILDKSQYMEIYEDEAAFEREAVEFTEEDISFWNEYKKINEQYSDFCVRKLAQQNVAVYNLAYKIISVFDKSGLVLRGDYISTPNECFAYDLIKCWRDLRNGRSYYGISLEFDNFAGTLTFPASKSAARTWLRFEIDEYNKMINKDLVKEVQDGLVLLQNEFAELFYTKR